MAEHPSRSLLRPAPWDTEFFGFPVARLSGDGPAVELLIAGKEEAVRGGIRCVFADVQLERANLSARPELHGYRFVEVSVWLRADASKRAKLGDQTLTVREGVPGDMVNLEPSIRLLAPWSRFANDPRFGLEQAMRVYRVWVESTIADPEGRVFVAEREGRPVGFLMCQSEPRVRVGLVATTEQRSGVGQRLIGEALDWARSQGEDLWVKTSLLNLPALRVYERCGFLVEDIRYEYHLWTDTQEETPRVLSPSSTDRDPAVVPRRTVAVLQPGYLPWLGFFEQMNRADTFVLLDDVQFSKNGWQNRNRVLGEDAPQWLTVPVKSSGRWGQRICEVVIDDRGAWARKHRLTLEQRYAKAPHFARYGDELRELYGRPWEYLVDLDRALIEWICLQLGLKGDVISSSELAIEDDDPNLRLIRICEKLGANSLYEGSAGRAFIDSGAFRRHGLEVEFQNYAHPYYKQSPRRPQFVSHLSVMDLLFNHGPESLDILTGRRIIPKPEDIAVIDANDFSRV